LVIDTEVVAFRQGVVPSGCFSWPACVGTTTSDDWKNIL
jgi:hypothetical protein